MLFSPKEIFDAIVVSIFVAYITQDFFLPRRLIFFDNERNHKKVAFYNALIFVSTSIILHELGHKFCATGLGYEARFHAAFTWLIIATILKSIGFPFIIFVPAYVSTNAIGFAQFFVALSGPLTNLMLYFLAPLFNKFFPSKNWYFFAYINWFLFVFNMLPIPGFDGFKALSALLEAIH